MEIRDATPERGDGRGWIVCVRCDNTQTIMGNRSKVSIRCLTIWKRQSEWKNNTFEAVVVGVLCLWARRELAPGTSAAIRC